MTQVQGYAAPRFSAVKDIFAASFARGEELGARFSLVQAGETLIDLWGGYADRAAARPFDEQTLTPVFSTTKAVTAFMVARLVEQGKITYEEPVSRVWPEFAQAGKDAVTIAQALSHQAGLSGFPDAMDPADWFDWDGVCARLAAMAPLWKPGTASGYHPSTFGFIAGEIFRRADGRTIGAALAQDVCAPHELDLWIGLPETEHHRCADIARPRGLPDFGEVNEATRAAFLTGWSAPGGRSQTQWRLAEFPGANGHATALALARLMAALADDGWLDGDVILAPAVIAEATAERIQGQDLVLPFCMSWAAGFMRNAALRVWGPGDQTFGHSGWGGSCAFADPERRLGGAYVMNRQSTALLGDTRPGALIDAVYAAL